MIFLFLNRMKFIFSSKKKLRLNKKFSLMKAEYSSQLTLYGIASKYLFSLNAYLFLISSFITGKNHKSDTTLYNKIEAL